MAKMYYKERFVHVYVMRSVDGLVKVGISENVIARAEYESLEGEKKEIVGICYSNEKIDIKTARIYESALLGFHRKHIINGSEWLATKWERVVETLDSMLDGKITKIRTNGENQRNALNDEFMKAKGYTRRYSCGVQIHNFLKNENGICKLVKQLSIGGTEFEICSLTTEEMMDYLTENGYTLIKKL